MRTFNNFLLIFASTLVLAAGCDEPQGESDPDFGGEDDEVVHRCIGPDCTGSGLGNTSKIGDHATSNLSETLGLNVANTDAGVRITGGTGYWGSAPMAIVQIDVEDDGELRLKLGTGGWISGTAVKNAWFNITVTPNDAGQATRTGKLLIADVRCDPGLYAPAMTICRYEFVTNIATSDPNYPMHAKLFGYYHTCPNENELGELTALEKYHSVLSPNVRLSDPAGASPRIDVSAGQFINGCLNGAVSKGQYYLNAFYDAAAFRGLATSQRTAMLLMWMAWFNGASRTEPGQIIWPHDPINGLFTWTADPTWGIEAGYDATGATCRGGTLAAGLHRLIPQPVLNLVGWADLPYCDAAHIANFATLGVKVEL